MPRENETVLFYSKLSDNVDHRNLIYIQRER